MKTLLARSLALIAFAIPVGAQAQSATHNWAGFYAGLHAGYGWGDNDVDVGCNDPTGSLDGTPNCSLTIGAGATETDYTTDLSGFIGGAQAGYNFQTGNLVFGLEADISWSSVDGSDSARPNAPPFDIQESRVGQELEWFGTVRGRLGLATGNWLLFATGGLAYADVSTRYSLSLPAVSSFSSNGSESDVETGWTAGGGAEMAFGQWSLKGEYLYFDLGDQDFSTKSVFLGATLPGKFEPDFETQGHIARIGLNFHFN